MNRGTEEQRNRGTDEQMNKRTDVQKNQESKKFQKTKIAQQFAEAYSLNKGIKELGEKGKEATRKEMSQLNNREVFEPIHDSYL